LVQAKPKYVQCNELEKSVPLHPIVGRHDLQSVTSLRESPSVAGLSTPRRASGRRDGTGKIYFDEVLYVPATRQMLEPVMLAPMLNPMHPPLARQLMARSIRTFWDAPLGWRYPSVLEQVRLIQVMPAMKVRDILDKP
jgi:hypothetical protein